MHLHVLRLPDAVGAVGGLVFHGRIPPTVKMENMACAGQVQADASGFERKDEHRRRILIFLEAAHHLIAQPGRRTAV